jgi:hypothetical protein
MPQKDNAYDKARITMQRHRRYPLKAKGCNAMKPFAVERFV